MTSCSACWGRRWTSRCPTAAARLQRPPRCWCSRPSSKIGSLDFRKHKEIADLGYAGASRSPRFRGTRWTTPRGMPVGEARAARRRTSPPVPEFVRIEGVGDKVDTKEIEEGLQPFLGSPARPVRARAGSHARHRRRLVQCGHLRRGPRERARGLLVHVDEKITGPPLLNFGLEVRIARPKGLSFDPSFRITTFNTLSKNSEMRLDGSFGTRLGVGAEHYQRFGLGRFFVAPAVGAERRITQYFVNGESLAEYEVQRYGMIAHAGVRLNADTELRAGYIFGRVDVERGIGARSSRSSAGWSAERTSCSATTARQARLRRPRSVGRRRRPVPGSQSHPCGRFPPARGPVVAVPFPGQTRPGVRPVCRWHLVWQRRCPSPTSFPSSGCTGCPGTRTTSFAGTTTCWRGPGI